MNKFERSVLASLFVSACLVSAASAQSRGPLVEREKSKPSVEVVDANAPIKPARWPFNLGRLLFDRDGDQGAAQSGDPFLNQGADQQQQLAAQLGAPNGGGANLMGRLNQQAPSGPGQIKTQSYPWPSPVDSTAQRQSGGPDGTTWKGGDSDTPGIVDRIRHASAKVLQREQETKSGTPTVLQPGPASPAPAQTIQLTDDTDYAQQAVTKYLERVEREGSVTGKVFNPLVESGAQPAPQIVPQQPTTATFAGATVPPNNFAPGAAPHNDTSTQPSYVQPSNPQPSYVQPVTRYVPGMPQRAVSSGVPTPLVSTPQAPAYVADAVGPTPMATAAGVPQPPWDAPANTVAPSQPMAAQAIPATESQSAGGRMPGPATAVPLRDSEFPAGNMQTSATSVPAPSLQQPHPIPAVPQTAPTAPLQAAQQPAAASLNSHLGTPDKNTRVLAIVGDHTILAGDVMTQVEQMLKPYRDQMTDEQYQEQMEMAMQRVLPRLVENKLVYLDFLRTVPPDKVPELEAKVFEFFRDSKLTEIQEELGVTTTAEVDAKLREMGSSLAQQQRLFLEQFVGREAVRRNVNIDAEITHDELLEFYHAHQDEFAFPARARWERLSAEVAKFGSREEAMNQLAQLGNQVMHGVDFQQVAKQGSHGPRADDGGQYDWTTKDSLKSKTIEELIFTLPPGKLSRIVEDEGSLHIVRVIERQDAGSEEFTDVQEKITKQIKEDRFRAGAEEYIARLRRETHVSTVFEEEPPMGSL